jgi:pilus assembly protein TadC
LLDGLSVSQAVGNSVALVHRYRFSSVGLLLVAVVISLVLSTIWNIPPSESWMRLVAITGNAFINTGLATATFIYYRERASSFKKTDNT